MRKNRLLLITLTMLLLFLPGTMSAATRVALVIGNGKYKVASLKNPSNDARDISSALNNLGFEVITLTDASKKEMLDSIYTFAGKLKRADIGLFFYAGHGMQINGSNYLIPIGTDVRSATDVEYEAVNAGRILGKMEEAGNRLNVVIFDACRNNPFRSYFRSREAGLAKMDAPVGTIIAFATAPGKVAADGTGRNGLYTKHLLKAIQQKGLTVRDLFDVAGLGVMRETNRQQVPWIHSSPMEPIVLAGGDPDIASDAGVGYGEEQKTATLMITSIPSGAQVAIDGKAMGVTPIHLGELASGSVRVVVSKSGFHPEEQQATLNPGQRTALEFALQEEIKMGRLTVHAIPRDASIRFLNSNREYRPNIELEAGRYHIEVGASDFKAVTKWVEVVAGGDQKLDISLTRLNPYPKPTGQTYTDPVTGMEFVLVPGGCFMMGCEERKADASGTGSVFASTPAWQWPLVVAAAVLPVGCAQKQQQLSYFERTGCEEDEVPAHEVCVDSFYIGKYEVTQEQWQRIMETNPSRFKKGGKYPVERVSWDDAQSFILELTNRNNQAFRLPSEAEWEYAARSGGKQEQYAGGNNPDAVAWYFVNSRGTTHPVGRKQANGLGLYDMSGNVWEWCQDWYDREYYLRSPLSDPAGPSTGSKRVYRGGSWNNFPGFVRAAFRDGSRAAGRFGFLGFRLVLPVQR